MEEGIKLHFTAAMISGLVTTIASMPVDIVKTRLQNQKVSRRSRRIESTANTLVNLFDTGVQFRQITRRFKKKSLLFFWRKLQSWATENYRKNLKKKSATL